MILKLLDFLCKKLETKNVRLAQYGRIPFEYKDQSIPFSKYEINPSRRKQE